MPAVHRDDDDMMTMMLRHVVSIFDSCTWLVLFPTYTNFWEWMPQGL